MVRGLGLRVERGVEVLRVDPRRGVPGGGASDCDCCVAFDKEGAEGSGLSMWILVNDHVGGPG